MKGLLRKFIDFALGSGIVLILGLISTPIITRIITTEEYGKSNMFTTVTSLMVLVMMMGIDQAYIRYYHEELEADRGKLLRKCVRIPIIVNAVVGIFILIFYKEISTFVIGEVSIKISILIILQSTITIISNFSLINIRMKQRGKLYSFVIIMNKVAYLVSIGLLFLIFKNNYITLVLSLIISNLIMGLIGIFLERKDWLDINRKKKIKTTTKELVAYGTPFIFSMAITWIFQSIDKVSLRIFSDYKQIGLYAGAMTIIGLLNTLQGAFTTFWIPVAYEKYSHQPDDTEFFRKINEIVSIAMLIISIGVIACKDIIVILLGKDYREAVFIFPFLVFMPIMYTISETTVLGINFKNKTKYHIYIALMSAISNIIGNLILVPKMGATGAAISTGISYIVFFLARTYLAGRFYKVGFKLGKFWVSVVSVYILATYSSTHRFNIIILGLTVGCIAIIAILYREILLEGINTIKQRIIKTDK